MKENEKSSKLNLEISKDLEENDILLDGSSKNQKGSFDNESLSEAFLYEETEGKNNNNKSKCSFFLNLPFIFYFFIILIIFTITLLIYYIIIFIKKEPNFKIVGLPWKEVDLNDREYQNYIFNNRLQVLLIHDSGFDMDGGAIVIEKGFLDDPFNEGIATLATYLLSQIYFNNNKKIPDLDDYFGNYKYSSDEYFTNFRFDILNVGLKKFLSSFGGILKERNWSSLFDEDQIEEAILQIDAIYNAKTRYIEFRENHLLEYFVYGFNNSNNEEILPEGNYDTLSKYNYKELKDNVSDYIHNLISHPEKMKIVLFSKYKFLISSKYMKKYFKDIIDRKRLDNKNNDNNNKYDEFKNFKKSQIFYIKANNYEPNYIKIIYYIDKVNNESFSELYYKENYFVYIIDFLDEKKEGSLYSLLTNDSNYNVKSIESYVEVILKSKIKLTIYIELNCLKNINDIIFKTYQFINKIINEAIGENLQVDRYTELKDLCYQNVKYTEKTFDTIELAKNNGENIVLTAYEPKFYFYFYCIPWNDNISLIRDESKQYFSQLKPENSVIILGLRDNDRHKMTCNDNSPFKLNCSLFRDNNNIKNTTYYEVSYINDVFNSSSFEKDLELNNSANINFKNNNYKSKHNETFKNIIKEKEKNNEFQELNKINTFNKFYFKRNVNFYVPKVYISLNLFHPYLRPNNTNSEDKKCNYFKIIEIFSAIKRKINEELADAIRAYNEFDFGQTENYLYINIYCYEDKASLILEKIRNIIYNTSWETTDFISNNEIYKNEVFDDFFMFDNTDIQEISRYYLYCQLKNSLFNKYEFFPQDFESNNYAICNSTINESELQNLTFFIINGTIYGFYEYDQAQQIYDLFDINQDFSSFKKILNNVEVKKDNIEDYYKWIIDINKLKETKEKHVYINESIYNKYDINNDNLGISYISLKVELLNVSILEALLNKTKSFTKNYIDFQMFVYRDIFFELLFYSENKNETIPNQELVKKEWFKSLGDLYIYNEPVDNIGNRYYYVIKNFLLTLIKKQTCLEQRAKDEIIGNQNEGIILDPGKIYTEYQEKYEGKKIDDKELDYTIRFYLNTISQENSTFYVHTLGK